MKIPRFVTAALAAVVCCAVLPAADAPKDVVLIDFTRSLRNPDGTYERPYQWASGDWNRTNKLAQIQDKGLLINHLSGKGNVGENRGLDFRKHSKVRIGIIIGNGNQATSIGLRLVDSDGTEAVWDISLTDKSKGTPHSVLLDMTAPSRVEKPGKTEDLNYKKLRSWQITGNWQDAPVEVLISKVTAVSK
jgi:hypothetical protein